MIEQRTKEWKLMRMGFFNGSEIGDLMGSGRKKDDIFGATAQSYIDKVAGERMLDIERFERDDEAFDKFDYVNNPSSRAMDYGSETEPEAKAAYEMVTGNAVEETTTTRHPSIEWFAASPDGLVEEFGSKGVLEIKCVGQKRVAEFQRKMKAGESLKDFDAKYYWQVQAEMMVTGRGWCDFVIYNPFMKDRQIVITRIQADESAQAEIKMRIELANQKIKNEYV